MAIHLHRDGFVVCIDNGPRPHWPQTTVRSEVTCKHCRPEATAANTTKSAAPVPETTTERDARVAAAAAKEARVVELMAELDRLEALGQDAPEILAELLPLIRKPDQAST
jgi:hypothetical protein